MGEQHDHHDHLAGVDDLARRMRDEVYHAKVVIRAQRNSTKTASAALADSEARLDALIDELETTDPQARRLTDNGNKALSQAH